MTPREFLDLAIAISSALVEYHHRFGHHGRLCPRCIGIPDAGGEVQILHSPEDAQGSFAGATNLLSDADLLPYIAPEATGRMNRQVDPRSDLYALGSMFHEMLAGAPPFTAGDVLGWIHAHVARTPPRLHVLADDIPRLLSDIVSKLLSKMAEDRYQTARGLRHDLTRLRAELDGPTPDFPLGERDVPDRFQLPAMLYGRDEQIAAIVHTFDDVVSTGKPALALVAGPSGIGKSALVGELERPIVREAGVFASGKCDQQREIPYAAISQAFGQIARQLLTESEARLLSFRERLLAAVSPNGRLLTDVVRDLELVLGEQPPVPPLPTQEAQNRLQRAFLDLCLVLAQKDHPLVLFFDDVQWADPGSLLLLQYVLANPTTNHLLVVCAYRDNEVDPRHPFATTVTALEQTPLTVVRVTPTPLTDEDVTDLVTDTFRCDESEAEPLAMLVRRQTEGNPFFVAQMLASLCQESLVAFDRESGAWRWDIGAIAAKGLSGDVLDLLSDKLRRLPETSRRVLSIAACLGSTFDPSLVAVAIGESEDETNARLRELARTGFVEIGDGGGKFAHDRIWQAAYALVPDEEKAAVHLDIGRRIVAARGEVDLFDRVSQLERGAALISDPEERLRLAELDRLATRKAMSSAAFRAAARYAAAGRSMLPPDAWEHHYELAYALHVDGATCENASGRFDEASELLATLIERARTTADRLNGHRVSIEVRINRGDFAGACGEAAECLAPLGVELKLHPTDGDVAEASTRALDLLGDRTIESLIDLEESPDETMSAALAVLATSYAPAHWVGMKLVNLIACRIVEISLRHGNADASVQGYAGFGAMLGPAYGRYREGGKFGKLSYDLAKRRGNAAHITRACNVYGGLASYFTQPYAVGVALATEGLETALQAGELTYGSFHAMQLVYFRAHDGSNLEEAWRIYEKTLTVAEENRLPLTAPFLLCIRGLLASLLGKTRSLSSFDEEGQTEADLEKQIEAMGPIFLHAYLSHKAIARTFARRYDEAITAAKHAHALSHFVASLVYGPTTVFFEALALAATYEDADPERRQAILQDLHRHTQSLGTWAENCAPNYASKHTLILAEIARIEGRELEAMRLYDRAIALGHEHRLIQDEAVAYEVAARFHLRQGRTLVGRAYLQEAREAYRRWGATAKVTELDNEGIYERDALPEPSRGAPTSRADGGPSTRPPGTSEPPLDAMAMAKAIQAISKEITTSGLLSALLRIVIEHAGAERCDLILVQRDELHLAASASSDSRGINVSVKDPIEPATSRDVPLSLLGYVMRTREPQILENASQKGLFTGDEHVMREETRSILCMPILRQQAIVGLLYLENNLARGAFTRKHLGLLEILAAQTAISLETAALYEDVARERRRVEDVLRENMELIAQQEDAILSLSTPIIEVWQGVLAMPLFGAIDERRAAQMMTVLLDAVSSQHCRYAVLDVTGVSMIDAATAEHLVRLVRAVQLLGAKGIVAGMRPDVARTIVSLGVDLGGIETRANLREALVRCMRKASAEERSA